MPDARRKIHIVLETGSLAGGVRVIGELANRMTLNGWEVTIWSVNDKNTMSWFALSPKVKWLSFYKTGTVLDYEPLAEVLQKTDGYKMATFWRTAFSVQHASKPGEGLYLVQDIETSYASKPLIADLVMKTYQLGLRHLTTSKWVMSQLPDAEYIGIGLDGFYKPLSGVPRANFPLAVIRRQALKGYSELAETCRYLNQAGKPLHTFGLDMTSLMFGSVVHNQYNFGKLKEGGENRPLSDKQVRQLYNTAAVFVCTSRHEGFNLTVLEAMACGLPVVKTHDDGSEEYCVDGMNCLMSNDPQELAGMALKVIQDKSLAASLSKEGLKTPRPYTWQAVMDRVNAILT